MDKNTLSGLLLMGAVILGFMWLNQPDPNAMRTSGENKEDIQANDYSAEDLLLSSLDTISNTEMALLATAIEQYGTRDTISTNTWHVTNQLVDLRSSNTTVRGSVVAADTIVDITTLSGNHIKELPAKVAREAVANVKKTITELTRYRGFARYLQGDSATVKLQNNLLSLDISNKGGVIARAELSQYSSFKGGNVVICQGDNNNYSFTLNSTDRRFDTRDFYFTPIVESDSTVLMQLDLGQGAVFGVRYTLHNDSYVVDMDIVQRGMEAVIPSSVATMDFSWEQELARQEEGRMFEERNSALYYKYAGGDVEYLSESSDDDDQIDERIKWIGYKNQFFSMVFIAKNNFNSGDFSSKVYPKSNQDYLKSFDTYATLDYNATNHNPASFSIFIGPNSYPLLSDLQNEICADDNLELTRLIPLGWALFRWINTIIVIPVFDFLGHWFTNYGVIILLLTLFIKLIIFPFTYKSYMSQARMRLLNPEIKAINEKYPGQENAMVRQQKMMELYSKAGANPMAGCLPMMLQMPVLIAMFTFFPSCIELRGESFLWAKDLSAPDAIWTWTTNIPFISEYFGNHLSLFCLLMTVTNIVYTYITMQNQPSSSQMPGMKWMMYLMPIMFLVFFNNYASGLSYYYFLSLLITIIQTYVFRHVVSEEKMRAKMAEAAKKPRKKSGFMARLEEAQRQQQAMLREQQKKNNNSKGRH